ncbi:hypothetical protein PHMEG_00017148 [Phytophthora megakarya]|uniref:Uncharacterized protein n=1 Tax=Phytophthora megakarya TaxID=4795 RepID=A0A225VZ39_9STRA|nr:hypothetical protein PHMEG_00017148 [Phytophthora megakarya]
MAVGCQDVYSILPEVLTGGTNSVTYVQSTVQALFAELFNNGLMIWIDDLIDYDDSKAVRHDLARIDALTSLPVPETS